MNSRIRLALALGIGLLLGIGASIATRGIADSATPPPTAPAALEDSQALPWHDVQLLADVLQRVKDNYVDPVSDHQLLHQAIRGMVAALDSHSVFLDPAEYEALKVATAGSYAGIGIEVEPSADGIVIAVRMAASPAAKAGLLQGDIITNIDGVDVVPTDLDGTITHLRGEAGTVVHLTVRRAGTPQPLNFAIEREQVELPSVAAQLLAPDVGYLRISSFTDGTAAELEAAVATLERASGAPLRGIVIDLRNNPGGVVDAAARVADDFLDQGVIVSAEGRTPEARFKLTAQPGDISAGAQLAVLVNGGSASAAEILAAALRDNGRATLIGRRTYGKGSVQTIMPLEDGAALKLTTSRYFTPLGVSINGIGINPDIVLAANDVSPMPLDAPGHSLTLASRDPQIGAALKNLRQHLSAPAGSRP